MMAGYKENPAFWTSLANKLDIVPRGSGYLLGQDGVLMGAIGCGGGIGEEDAQPAEAGAEAVST